MIAPIGPGRLVLVVGPSGAGKDTLIELVRDACRDNERVLFPRRIVTRPSSAAEDNETLSETEFAAAIAEGAFAVHWRAHGHCYGLPIAINDAIVAGACVVANVSRSVVAALRAAYADVVVVSVTAPVEVLAQRLAARSRDTDGPLDERLKRAVDDTALKPDVTIVNVGPAADHARELLRAIEG
ncbi:phosphonate metabolism protein/1,5-bisphosphokinase (PRPP-forming) PhnN [Rhodopseudomonas pseudopalustris]|uniref:phosphonate metabolism protein/1,5-bisphosphokinase (PRPP-forming) PhnN n=1 Tax=Rhodopseudomonas pseudopalustris TaxID=1513892 RepID=UPI003F99B97D